MTCPHCQKRSSPQHRRMFKVISLAFDQWPDPNILDAKHLRALLLVKAGYSNVTEINMSTAPSDHLLVLLYSVMRAVGSYGWIRERGGRVFVISPKSMRFDKLSHKDACVLFNKIEDIICAEIGIESCDQLLSEAMKVA